MRDITARIHLPDLISRVDGHQLRLAAVLTSSELECLQMLARPWIMMALLCNLLGSDGLRHDKLLAGLSPWFTKDFGRSW